jgi:hypothetical protein
MLRGLLILMLIALPMIACDSGGSFNVWNDEQYNYLSISLTETQIRDMIVPSLQNGREFRMQNVSIDLRPGEIVVLGDVVGDGGRLYPGSMSIRAGASNGQLQLSVGTFSFAGYNASQEQLSRFNADMQAGLSQSAQNSDSQTHAVSITDTAFSITWRSPR